jgi:hypothetical protein
VDFTDFVTSVSIENMALIDLATIGAGLTEANARFKSLVASIPSTVKGFNFVDTALSVKSINSPEVTLGYKTYDVAGMTVKGYVNELTIPDITIEFYKETQNFLKTMYYNWISLAVDLNSGAKRPRNFYEKTIGIYIFDRMGLPVETARYYGCCPTELNSDKFDAGERNFLEEGSLTLAVNNGYEKTIF